jgi:hypothetical protein
MCCLNWSTFSCTVWLKGTFSRTVWIRRLSHVLFELEHPPPEGIQNSPDFWPLAPDIHKNNTRRLILRMFGRWEQRWTKVASEGSSLSIFAALPKIWSRTFWSHGYNVIIDARVIHIRNSGHKQCNPRKEFQKARKYVPSFQESRDISPDSVYPWTLFPRAMGLFDTSGLIPDSTALNG